MNLNEIINRSKKIFREVFDDDEIDITPETTAEDIEEWDSLSQMRLIVAIKEYSLQELNKNI